MKKINITIKQLVQSNLHIGHIKTRWNPQTSSFLIGVINNIHIIKLSHTISTLRTMIKFISSILTNSGYLMVYLDSFNNVNNLVQVYSNRYIQYYKKTINGLLTNKEILLATNYMPDSIFFFNIEKNKNILKEANYLKIPTIGLVNSNNNPQMLDYYIPSNNNSIQAYQFYLNLFNHIIFNTYIEQSLSYKQKYQLYQYT